MSRRMIMAEYYGFTLDVRESVSPSVSPLVGHTNGHILGRHLVGTLHRVCFSSSMVPKKKEGLVGNFYIFVYGNLTLSTQYVSICRNIRRSVRFLFPDIT